MIRESALVSIGQPARGRWRSENHREAEALIGTSGIFSLTVNDHPSLQLLVLCRPVSLLVRPPEGRSWEDSTGESFHIAGMMPWSASGYFTLR